MLTGTQENEEIIARVAALDIGKAELMCCVRVPDEDRPGRRLQEVHGERNPKVLAQLARRSMRAKITVLEEAFTGHFTDHHAFVLRIMLGRVDAISADIAALDERIAAQAAPLADAVARLDEIPGISLASAHVILAEIGTDMTRFPTAGHLLSDPDARFEDLGPGYYAERIDVEALGYTVTLQPAG